MHDCENYGADITEAHTKLYEFLTQLNMWIVEWKEPWGYNYYAQIGTYAELSLRQLDIEQLADGAMLDIGMCGTGVTRTEALLNAIGLYPALVIPQEPVVNWSEDNH